MVTRTGTPGDDDVLIDGASFPDNTVEQLDVETGTGNDNVRFTGFLDVLGDITINTGEGRGSVSFGDGEFFAGRIVIDTGSEDDVIDAVGTGNAEADFIEIRSGDGNDHIKFDASSESSIIVEDGVIDAGDGNDLLEISADSAILKISGGEGNDDIIFNAFFDQGSSIDGGPGNDHLEIVGASTRSEDGIIANGGDGDDRFTLRDLLAVADDEFLTENLFVANGGAGDDTFTVDSSGQPEFGRPPSDAELNGGAGNDRLNGGAGNDILNGGDGHDILFGGAGKNVINGGDGYDQMVGGDDDDDMDGGAGNDRMLGGAGNDTIRTGRGFDLVDPGSGKDILVFGKNEGTTHVNNFNVAEDRLDLTAADTSRADVVASAREEDRPFFDRGAGQYLGGRNAVVIEFEGTEIVLRNTNLDDLSEDIFIVDVEDAVA